MVRKNGLPNLKKGGGGGGLSAEHAKQGITSCIYKISVRFIFGSVKVYSVKLVKKAYLLKTRITPNGLTTGRSDQIVFHHHYINLA